MHGVVTAFDANDGVGIIDGENGELVLFNSANLRHPDERWLRVGTRVRFVAHQSEHGIHADLVDLED